MTTVQRQFFIPAETSLEAIERIFALTGRARDTSRGEKRALIALRDALRLDVDVVALGSTLAREIARNLDIEWDEARFTNRSTVTLDGLNALLEGATQAYQEGALAQLIEGRPVALEGPEWAAFRPARKKIEAVTRIAGLTHAPPESLGPGSKEHKSVFLNLAAALFPHLRTDGLTKTQLGETLANELRVPWLDNCYSTQQSISLIGLNTILAGAERHLGRIGGSAARSLTTAAEEGAALAAAILDGIPDHWDGRTSIKWMRDQGIRGWRDNEWQGFYNEAISRQVLSAAFPPSLTPPRVRYGNTTFDYALNRVWDLKAHTEYQIFASTGVRSPGRDAIILNDEDAIRECARDQGIGFLVLGGAAEMDETGDFVEWHRSFKSETGSPSAPSNSERSRTRKKSFTPLHIEAFWVDNTHALDAAVAAGRLVVRAQGRQAPKVAGGAGNVRKDKFHMNVEMARKQLSLARYEWHGKPAKISAAAESDPSGFTSARPSKQDDPRPAFTYVDLFAGIGGFHAMLDHAGGRCVYVSEIDEEARQTYSRNWIDPLPSARPTVNTDITLDAPDDGPVDVPDHDVLAAGFPLQPFASPGSRRLTDDGTGKLFWNIARILQERTPAVVMLENVRNLAGPRYSHEWNVIIQTLRGIGYRVSSTPSLFSPHLLPPSLGGTPQARDRVFILGTYVGPERAMREVDVPPTVVHTPVAGWNVHDWNVQWVLDDDSSIPNLTKYQLNTEETEWINVWDDLVQRLWSARGVRLPGFPLWADAWIPGRALDTMELEALPWWKADFLVKNARFYDEHRDIIEAWKKANPAFANFPESRRKLEWQAQDTASLWDTVMHFRPSGIRAKVPTYLPALVAITQASIVGSRRRRLTPHEAAKLQGFGRSFTFGGQRDQASYKQVGNSLAVGAAWHVFRTHVAQSAEDLPSSLVNSVLGAALNPTRDALDPAAFAAEAQLRESSW